MGRADTVGQGPERAAPNLIRAADVIDPTLSVTAPRTASTSTPKSWLSLIDKLIEAREPQEALDQWKRFRIAYPNHPVPPELAARLKTLEERP